MFNLTYVNSQHKYNNLYSEWINLNEDVKMKNLPSEEYIQQNSYSRTKMIGFDVSRSNSIRDVLKAAMKQLSEFSALESYEIGFKVKKAILSHKKPEVINAVKLKGVINNERKTIWFDIVLDSQEFAEEINVEDLLSESESDEESSSE